MQCRSVGSDIRRTATSHCSTMMKMETSTLTKCLTLLALLQPLVLCQSNTTTVPPAIRYQMAFGVARNSSQTSDGELSFPQNVSNVNGWYRQGSENFAARVTGLYFLFVCIGVAPHSRVNVRQVGGYPPMGYTWNSTSHNGVKLGCRASIATLSPGVRISLNATGGGIFSDNQQETSFSAFSISDAMTSGRESLYVSYVATALYDTLGTIPFGLKSLVYVNPTDTTKPLSQSLYNTAEYTYTCPHDGYYFVSISVGVPSGQYAQVLLTADYDPINFELTRTSLATNGVTTLSRSVLVSCSSQTKLWAQLINGVITSGDTPANNLVSFTVIPYAPNGTSTAWALYRDSSWSTINDANLTFNQVNLVGGMSYNAGGALVVSNSGTYMVYLSAATVPNQSMNLVVKRNGDVIVGLVSSPTETDGADMVEHGVIVGLNSGDVLVVVGASGSSVHSDSGLQAAFWGFLIYDA